MRYEKNAVSQDTAMITLLHQGGITTAETHVYAGITMLVSGWRSASYRAQLALADSRTVSQLQPAKTIVAPWPERQTSVKFM